ncbi:protein GrpE [Agaricicola taiwanensis]|uniref:Protein GrpE n=2 Tax=Agaricicola taiwanensis TaxID=591372 RepID=A0A8J2YFG0_9RHOB|nr:protein GrpE [Agaricicola taiwanensis]
MDVASIAEGELKRLETEAYQLKDRLMRTLAEMENLRKRTEREVADAKIYAVSSFARDLLSVADNMDRALAALPETRDEALSAFAEGVELTSRELLKVLQKHGVKRISPSGEKFDPHFHQAMFEVEDATVPSGTVVQVMQDGYVIGERALRPAFVGVSKGGAKAQRQDTAEPAIGERQPGEGVDRSA